MKFLTIIVSLAITSTGHTKGQEVQFDTADGITVYGEVYKAPDMPKSAPLILLFHQGASK